MATVKDKIREQIPLILVALLAAGITWALSAPDWARYTARVLAWNFSDFRDHEKFPERPVENAPPTFFFREEPAGELFTTIQYRYRGEERQADFDQFLAGNQTTAFIVIQDDAILYEKYFNGYTREDIMTSFSMAKSFVSALVGIAIDEGLIGSVDDPMTWYLPELRGRGFDQISIRQLLNMSSGIHYREYPFGDDAKTYYFPDLRYIAQQIRPGQAPAGSAFHYNNYHPLLLGMILERATRQPVANYLEEKIWKPLGMEFPASWSLDSERSGFEKMESGINARAIDYAKFGRLFLKQGNLDGQQIVSQGWVAESTQPDPDDRRAWSTFSGFKDRGGYYKYMWWGKVKDSGGYDFAALGHLSQVIYVNPEKRVVIVRSGFGDGRVDSWFDVAASVAEMIR